MRLRQWCSRPGNLARPGSVCLATLLALGGLATPARANLIQNGSFETGGFTGWTRSGSNLDYVVSATGTKGSVSYGPESGTYYVQFDAYVGSPATISQTIATTIGQNYDFSFWVGSVGGTPNTMTAKFGTQTVLNISSEPDTAFVNYTYIVTATSASTTVSFSGADNPLWMLLDNVSVAAAAAPVPEPAGMAMFGLGLLGLAVAHRRRRAA